MTIVAISVVGMMANSVEYTVLYTGLDEATAGAIYENLTERGVDVQARADGTILVPKEDAAALRYSLSNEGIPETEMTYELYQENASSFNATDRDKALWEKYQLQINIARTINKMDKISGSTVMLSLAETSQFVLSNNTNTESTASVMVEVAPGQTLTDSDVAAIRNVVAGAVPSLPTENISVVDQYMISYGGSGDDASSTETVNDQITLQNTVRQSLEQQIIKLLSPVFGLEKLSASVNVVLNFDTYSSESITLEPPGDADNMGIIVSMKTMEERIIGADAAQGEPGLDTNGGAPVYQEVTGATEDDIYYQNSQEINAEVNQLIEKMERAKGTISDLSATLVIDGGDEIEEFLPEIRTMIATAVGIPEDRITVSNMPFEENARLQQLADEQAEAIAEMERNDMLRTLIIPIAIVAAIIIIIALMLNANKKKKQMELDAQRLQWEAEQLAAQEQEQQGQLDIMVDDGMTAEELLQATDKDKTLDQLQTLIDSNPAIIAQVLRNWLLDEGR